MLLQLNIISNHQGNKYYFDFPLLETYSLQPDSVLCSVGPSWRRTEGLGWGNHVSNMDGKEAERTKLHADDSVAEKLAGSVSPSEDLGTDSV